MTPAHDVAASPLRGETPARIATGRTSFWLWRPSHRHWLGHLLLAPGLLVTLILIVYPLTLALDLSFQRVRLMRVGAPRLPFTIDNYLRLAQAPEFWNACVVSLAFVVLVTAGSFVVGIGAALLVNERFPGRRAARLLVALPWAVPEVVAAAIWSWMFDGAFGLFNWLLMRAGIVSDPVAWLSQPHEAFAVCTIVLIWTGYPFVAVMALAGLQAIPTELYEAAHMDGARAFERFRFVTLPSLRPVCMIALRARRTARRPRLRDRLRPHRRRPDRRDPQPRDLHLRAGVQLLQHRVCRRRSAS